LAAAMRYVVSYPITQVKDNITVWVRQSRLSMSDGHLSLSLSLGGGVYTTDRTLMLSQTVITSGQRPSKGYVPTGHAAVVNINLLSEWRRFMASSISDRFCIVKRLPVERSSPIKCMGKFSLGGRAEKKAIAGVLPHQHPGAKWQQPAKR